MKISNLLLILLVCISVAAWGCDKSRPIPPSSATPSPVRSDAPSALPDNGFKAVITVTDAPVKLRAGQKQALQVKVKNASDVLWYARGAAVNNNPDNRFYLAVGNRWLEANGEKLITNMDGRYGLPRDLNPGEETEVPLVVTAPKTPGDYILDVDLVQEQVAWFHDKGSPTARLKITVER
jgi:hypothetical protein